MKHLLVSLITLLGFTLPLHAANAPIIWGSNNSAQLLPPYLMFLQGPSPVASPVGYDFLYFKTDDKLYGMNSAGVEVLIGPSGGGGGGGTVTSVSVVSANGLAGTVATATTTPAITISTSVVGLAKGNGTGFSAAVAGTDYQAPISTSGAVANQFLTAFTAPNTFSRAQPSFSNLSGTATVAQGGTNSGTALNNNRVMESLGGAIVEAAAITANKALVSNASGLPIASGVSDTTLAFLDATSSVQTQLNGKQATGNYITALTSDVTAAGPGSVAATVAFVGTSSAANVHTAELLANAATSANTASTIVKRNASGNFSASDLTINSSVGGSGTAVNPTYAFSETGNDTGIYSQSDGDISFSNNAGLGMNLDSSHNLHVVGNVTAANFPTVGAANNFAGYDGAGNLSNVPGWVFGSSNGATLVGTGLTYNVPPDGTPTTVKIDDFEIEWNAANTNTDQSLYGMALDSHVDRTHSGNNVSNVVGLGMSASVEGSGVVNNHSVLTLNHNLLGNAGGTTNTASDISVAAGTGPLYNLGSYSGIDMSFNANATSVVGDIFDAHFATSGDNTGNYTGLFQSQTGNIGGSYNGLGVAQNGTIAGSANSLSITQNGAITGAYTGGFISQTGDTAGWQGLNVSKASGNMTNAEGARIGFGNGTATSKSAFVAIMGDGVTSGSGRIMDTSWGAGNYSDRISLNLGGGSGNITTSDTGLNLSSTSGTTGSFQGLNINSNGTTTTNDWNGATINGTGSAQNVKGLSMTLDNINSPNYKVALSISGGAINSNYTLDTSVFTPGFEYQVNSIGGGLGVAAGFPLTGQFGFLNNLGGTIQFNDNMPADGSGLGLGTSFNGLVGQIGGAAGKTADAIGYMSAGASDLGTDGTIDKHWNYRSFGVLPPGAGTPLTINNEVGFWADASLDLHTYGNLWGVLVDSLNADNWFAKNVVVGGVSKHPTNASVGVEIAGTTKALLNARMNTAARNALTAVNGMQIYNTTTDALECYAGGAWGSCASAAGVVTNVTATAPILSSGGTTPDISIPASTNAVDGYLTAADHTTFAAKLSSALTSAHLFVGSGGNVATDVAASGDITLANTGAFTVATVGASSAANIHSAELLANAATSANTANAIVKRGAAGEFSAGAGTFSGALDVSSNQIHNVTDPTSTQDAATKSYVDSVAADGVAKGASVYASTAALPANVYNNGASGVGATLTGVAFGALVVDGNTVTIGQRILVKNEATGANNGIYTVTTVGAVATLYVLTRATDFNSTADIVDGATTYVTSGATLSTQTWQLTVAGSVTVGTTALTFNQISGPGTILAGNGLTLVGSTISLVAPVSIANGGRNSTAALNNNRVIESLAGAIVEAAAITANRALVSDASGLPIASSVTDTTLAFLDATSSVQTQLNARALSARLINTTAPLTGGGDLSADRTIAIPASTNAVDGYLTAADHTTFAAKLTSTLANGSIFIGSAGNIATAQAVTGDIAITNAGVTSYSGTVPINKGGTGATTAQTAINAIAGLTTKGDILIHNGTNDVRQAACTNGQYIQYQSGQATGVLCVTPSTGATQVQEVPSGTINGSNVTFTLAQTPAANSSVVVYINGLFQRQGTDYTISSTTITMTTAPALGQSIDAVYNKF